MEKIIALSISIASLICGLALMCGTDTRQLIGAFFAVLLAVMVSYEYWIKEEV